MMLPPDHFRGGRDRSRRRLAARKPRAEELDDLAKVTEAA